MNIRASMLPSYPDCSRRAAAKQFGKQLGIEVRNLPPSVGAAAGTAVHKGCEMLLRQAWSGVARSMSDAASIAIETFREEIAPGVIWDDTTPNLPAAEMQIRKMISVYPVAIPATVRNAPAVELELEASAGQGWRLTGHIDLITNAGWIRDTKTGAVSRPYYTQLGAYSLLVRSNKIISRTSGVAIDFIKRVGKLRQQAANEEQIYPVGVCEREATGVISRIISDVGRFVETGNPREFTANPMSMMCSDKYCPAWGTSFCELKGR